MKRLFVLVALAVAGCVSSSYKLKVEKPETTGTAKYFIKDIGPAEKYSGSLVEWQEQQRQRESDAFWEMVHAEGLDEALSRDGAARESLPISVKWKSSQKNGGGATGPAFVLTLGVIPLVSDTTGTYEITVQSPAGDRTGSFEIERKEWYGWIPLFIPYPTFDSDKRDDEIYYSPGDLVERGLARKTLELAQTLDYDGYIAKQKHLEAIPASIDRASLEKDVKGDDAEIRDAAAKRLEELLLQDIAASGDAEWLHGILQSDPRTSIKRAAHARWTNVMTAKVDALENVEELRKIAAGTTAPSVSEKARNKVVEIVSAKIAGMDDKAELEKIATSEDYEEIRTAARERIVALRIPEIEAMTDMAALEELAQNHDEAEAIRSVADARWIALAAEQAASSQDQAFLAQIAQKEGPQYDSLRLGIIGRLTDQNILAAIATSAASPELRKAALANITTEDAIADVVRRLHVEAMRFGSDEKLINELLALASAKRNELKEKRLAEEKARREAEETKRLAAVYQKAESLSAEGKWQEALQLLQNETLDKNTKYVAGKILDGAIVAKMKETLDKTETFKQLDSEGKHEDAIELMDNILAGNAELEYAAKFEHQNDKTKTLAENRECCAKVRALQVRLLLQNYAEKIKALAKEGKEDEAIYISKTIVDRGRDWWLKHAAADDYATISRILEAHGMRVSVAKAMSNMKEGDARWKEIAGFMRNEPDKARIADMMQSMDGAIVCAVGKAVNASSMDWFYLTVDAGKKYVDYGWGYDIEANIHISNIRACPEEFFDKLEDGNGVLVVGMVDARVPWQNAIGGGFSITLRDAVLCRPDGNEFWYLYTGVLPQLETVNAVRISAATFNKMNSTWQKYLSFANKRFASNLQQKAAWREFAGRRINVCGEFKNAYEGFLGGVNMELDVDGLEIKVEMETSQIAKCVSLSKGDIVSISAVFGDDPDGARLCKGNIDKVLFGNDAGKANDAAMELQKKHEEREEAETKFERDLDNLQKTLSEPFEEPSAEEAAEFFINGLQQLENMNF